MPNHRESLKFPEGPILMQAFFLQVAVDKEMALLEWISLGRKAEKTGSQNALNHRNLQTVQLLELNFPIGFLFKA